MHTLEEMGKEFIQLYRDALSKTIYHKEELQDYMDKGKSPSQFGPHIVNSATIKRFMITAKNRRQNALECDFDFSGDSYETTKFD